MSEKEPEDTEPTQEFTKHLMQRHAALAEQVRESSAKTLELIEQYTRPDFYLWLMHDANGLKSDPCKRATEAKKILTKLAALKVGQP